MFHLYQDIQITNQQRNKNPQVLYVTSVRNKQLIKKKYQDFKKNKITFKYY